MNFHVNWNRYFTGYINTLLEYETWLPSTEGVQELMDMALNKLDQTYFEKAAGGAP